VAYSASQNISNFDASYDGGIPYASGSNGYKGGGGEASLFSNGFDGYSDQTTEAQHTNNINDIRIGCGGGGGAQFLYITIDSTNTDRRYLGCPGGYSALYIYYWGCKITMAILLNKKYVKIVKEKNTMKMEGDGIFNCYCTFEVYSSKQDRDTEKRIISERLEFITKLVKFKNTVDDLTYTTEFINSLNKFISGFDCHRNRKPNIPDDLEFVEVLNNCGYKEEWYTTEIKMEPGQTTILVATINLNNIKEPINYSFFYNRLKQYLVGEKEDVW